MLGKRAARIYQYLIIFNGTQHDRLIIYLLLDKEVVPCAFIGGMVGRITQMGKRVSLLRNFSPLS